jgi:hypothetical protein
MASGERELFRLDVDSDEPHAQEREVFPTGSER